MRDDLTERFSESRCQYKKNSFPRRKKKISRLDSDGYATEVKSMSKLHYFAGDWDHNNGYIYDYSFLCRILESKKGEKWDDVYSELCQASDERSYDGWKFREAVKRMVCINVTIEKDGSIYKSDGGFRVQLDGRNLMFFVHPETKCLEVVPCIRHKIAKKSINKYSKKKVFEMEGVLYHKHKNLWYRVEMAALPQNRTYDWLGNMEGAVDAFQVPLRINNYSSNLAKKYGYDDNRHCWYCKTKQAANSQEIKKLKKLYDLD